MILILKPVVPGCQVGSRTRRDSRDEIQRRPQSGKLIRLLDKPTCTILRRNFTRRNELNIQTSRMPLERSQAMSSQPTNRCDTCKRAVSTRARPITQRMSLRLSSHKDSSQQIFEIPDREVPATQISQGPKGVKKKKKKSWIKSTSPKQSWSPITSYTRLRLLRG